MLVVGLGTEPGEEVAYLSCDKDLASFLRIYDTARHHLHRTPVPFASWHIQLDSTAISF